MNTNPPKRGLGRGLEALLTEKPTVPSVKVNAASATSLEWGKAQAINELTLEAQTLKSLLEDLEDWLETIEVSDESLRGESVAEDWLNQQSPKKQQTF